MAASEDRLRPHPSDRFAGEERELDLETSLRSLRAEPHSSANGHRQIALAHHGPVRLVLYAFDAGGHMAEHRAPGFVTIHVLRGAISVRTPTAHHMLTAGRLLTLAPDVAHDVEASEESDMLLGVYLEAPTNASAVEP